ncbi:MAG: STAS domain-containing protein [Chloroflexi bacterium]|nr:STAS domain-containing protein [Chloroflexota bacterium]
MELKVEEQAGSQAVVKVEGRLDANTAEAFKVKFKNIVAAGLTRLVIDMGVVSFIDSSGLSALIAGFRMVREQNGALILARPSNQGSFRTDPPKPGFLSSS